MRKGNGIWCLGFIDDFSIGFIDDFSKLLAAEARLLIVNTWVDVIKVKIKFMHK